MSEEAAKNGWWTPIRVGLALTAIVLVGFVAMALQRNCIFTNASVLDCQRNWVRFWASRPNEIGDTLAGFAGSLAFIWIVVTVWLQSSELRVQREELKLTRLEIEGQRIASQEMAQAQIEQARLMEDERRRRDYEAISRYVEELLRSTVTVLTNPHLVAAKIVFKSGPATSEIGLTRFLKGASDLDSKFLNINSTISIMSEILSHEMKSSILVSHDIQGAAEDIDSARIKCGMILMHASRGDSIILERVSRLKVEQMLTSLDEVHRNLQLISNAGTP